MAMFVAHTKEQLASGASDGGSPHLATLFKNHNTES